MSILGNPVTLGGKNGNSGIDFSGIKNAVVFKSFGFDYTEHISKEFEISVTDSSSGALWTGSLYWANAEHDWTEWTDQTTPIQSAGGIIALRGQSVSFRGNHTRHFAFGGDSTEIEAFGNFSVLGESRIGQGMFGGDFSYLFKDCTRLTLAPNIDIDAYYKYTFSGCTGLVYPPNILLAPSTNIVSLYSMLEGCTSLKYAPNIPFTGRLDAGVLGRMCFGCTSLETLPIIRSTAIRYTSNGGGALAQMFDGCTKIKLSTEQTGNYTIPWSIPNYTTVNARALTNMFANTGGPFTGTPTIGTIYYLHNGQADA